MASAPEASDKIKLLATFAFVYLTASSGHAMTARELVIVLDEKLSDQELPDVHFTTEEMTMSAEMLLRHGLIRKHEYRHTKTRYEAVHEARTRLTGSEEFAEELTLFVRLSYPWLREALENISKTELTDTYSNDQIESSSHDSDENLVPASDRIVRLDDNQRSYASTSIAEIAETLRSGEQPTNISEEERLMVLGQLDLAMRMIEASPVMTASTLRVVLLSPICFLVDRVTAGIIGNKATELLNFLMELL